MSSAISTPIAFCKIRKGFFARFPAGLLPERSIADKRLNQVHLEIYGIYCRRGFF